MKKMKKMKTVMKKTTLFIAIIALLTACSKDENLLPVPQSPNDPSLRTSNNQGLLYTIEETHYTIKTSDFYQYHQNAWYIPGDNYIIEHTRYNLGELKVANDGTGYLKSNIIPNDLTFPFRPWGSATNYNFVFTFTMTDYSVSNDTVRFDLYSVSCNNDTTFYTSTFKIVPSSVINRIRLEQVYGGSFWDRQIIYELEKTNGGINVLAAEKKH